jgi:NADH dehydrogenase FAD-containing subunit
VPGLHFYMAWAKEIDVAGKSVLCQSLFDAAVPDRHVGEFRLPFDHLLIAVGAHNRTFGVRGTCSNGARSLWQPNACGWQALPSTRTF